MIITLHHHLYCGRRFIKIIQLYHILIIRPCMDIYIQFDLKMNNFGGTKNCSTMSV